MTYTLVYFGIDTRTDEKGLIDVKVVDVFSADSARTEGWLIAPKPKERYIGVTLHDLKGDPVEALPEFLKVLNWLHPYSKFPKPKQYYIDKYMEITGIDLDDIGVLSRVI